MIPESLACKRDMIAARWLELTLDLCPAETRRFFIQEKDPFRNPVGSEFRRGLPLLLDVLFDGKDLREACPVLETIVRWKAVQEAEASQACSFLFLLGEIVRRAMDSGDDAEESSRFLADLDGRIRDLVRMAEAMFTECRAQITRLRAVESSRRFFVHQRIAVRQKRNGDLRSTRVSSEL